MKSKFLALFAFVLAQFLAAKAIAAAGGHTQFLPMQPSDLVAAMPAAPQGWSMLSSLGTSTFMNQWLTTMGIRTFKKPPPPPTKPGEVPAKPETMAIYVTDTGYQTEFTSVVTPAKGAAAQPNTTYLQVGQFPAKMIKVDDGSIRLDIVVKSRFLVEVRTTNVQDDDLKKYADAFDFSKLEAAPDVGSAMLPNPVTVVRYDELNPKNTRSYPVFWQGPPPTSK